MSTIHGSPYWNPVALEATPYKAQVEKEGIVSGWEIKQNSQFTQKMQIWGSILNEVFDGVIGAANLGIRNATPEKKGMPFFVNPTNSFNSAVENLSQGPSYKGKIKIITDVTAYLAGVYLTERRGLGPLLICGIEGNQLPVNQFSFNYSMKNNDLKNWRARMYIDCITYFYHNIGKLRTLGAFVLTEEDKLFLGGSQQLEAMDSAKMSCFAYALLKVREVQAKQLILNTKRDPVLTLGTFKEWDYRIVERPDDGDLVLYMNDAQDIVLHLGIARDVKTSCELLIESKLGINAPEAYLHRVFDVPANYGTKVVFMRKNPSLSAEKSSINETAKALTQKSGDSNEISLKDTSI